MTSRAKIEAQARYDKENTQSVMIKLNKKTDSDILAKLSEVPNKQGYIKDLIRGDLRSDGDVATVESLQYLLLPVFKKYGIKKARLFGSYARGEANSASDVDIVIDGGGLDDLIKYFEFTEACKKATQRKTDVLMEEAIRSDNSRASRRLWEHIQREGVVIYEEDK